MSSKPPSTIDRTTKLRLSSETTGRTPLRYPALDDNEHIYIALAVLIPIICTFILCIITYCIYRYKNKRNQQSTTTSINQDDALNSTIIYNSKHNPFTFEESPPSYDHISETKKDPQLLTSNNYITEQFQSSTKNEIIATGYISSPPYPHYVDPTK